jgi:hypothetical protein
MRIVTGVFLNHRGFPQGLLDWAGHRSGGVRRLFHAPSGRPSGQLIRTNLIERLHRWADDLLKSRATTPRVVVLVGGPGNGKTEAIESCIRRLDELMALNGRLVDAIEKDFMPGNGRPVPRLASVEMGRLSTKYSFTLAIVQDASASEEAAQSKSPAELFLEDLDRYAVADTNAVYLACVNRGVLDEAFVVAIDRGNLNARKLLEQTIRAVGLTSDAPSAWPLDLYPSVAVWPMDIESLFVSATPSVPAAAQQLLAIATERGSWPAYRTCPAGKLCPHCTSRDLLGQLGRQDALLQLLRWYELASGKRWSFRDLGSLISFLLAGVSDQSISDSGTPCTRAAKLIELHATGAASPKSAQALFLLVDALYQHALFGKWSRSAAKTLRRDIRDLGVDNDQTLMGFMYFLTGQRKRSLPSTLEPQLNSLSELLDPALADADQPISNGTHSSFRCRDIDAHFSQSVFDGLRLAQQLNSITELEEKLLTCLGFADQKLSTPEVASRRPAAALRVQKQLRDFCCRLVRRSVGVQFGICRDAAMLVKFQSVLNGDRSLLYEVVKQVEGLLNDDEHFVTSLNTTFGEPLPPVTRRAVLETQKQRVRPQLNRIEGRPEPDLSFLAVGGTHTKQSVALTYELFKSVTELSHGMLVATLPRTVVALLDATRARLAGQIVRDEELLDGCEIRLGVRNEVVVRELGGFVVRLDT